MDYRNESMIGFNFSLNFELENWNPFFLVQGKISKPANKEENKRWKKIFINNDLDFLSRDLMLELHMCNNAVFQIRHAHA